jgi:hypothetical protein
MDTQSTQSKPDFSALDAELAGMVKRLGEILAALDLGRRYKLADAALKVTSNGWFLISGESDLTMGCPYICERTLSGAIAELEKWTADVIGASRKKREEAARLIREADALDALSEEAGP